MRRQQLETDRALIIGQTARERAERLLRSYQGARSEIDAALQDVQGSAGRGVERGPGSPTS